MAKVTKSFQYGSHEVTLETGEIARQASGAVMVSMGGTVVLVTAVAATKQKEGQDFFPLTVDYVEKIYSAGRIPGGFFKREGRPTEKETLTSRLIDRPVRPLFPEDFKNEVQVIAQVVSMNPEIDGDIVALLGASAALSLAGIPFKGPIGAARVGYANGSYLLNPTATELKTSSLDLVVAGTAGAVLMVESEAQLLSEDVMLGAVMFGHHQMQTAIRAIAELAAEAAKPSWDWQAPARNESLVAAIKGAVGSKLEEAFQVRDKLQRRDAISAIKADVMAELKAQAEANAWAAGEMSKEFGELEYHTMRDSVLKTKVRIDGRQLDDVRAITARVGVLPRTHGSALFTRGETQALVIVTLGTTRDAQVIDAPGGESKDPFLFHYNFPPFSVGEAGRFGAPKRREIGHGRLAKRGVQAVKPTIEEFPYVVRVVSEITESNGSSSMASVCGSSLAMMDAGVPLKAPVADEVVGEHDSFRWWTTGLVHPRVPRSEEAGKEGEPYLTNGPYNTRASGHTDRVVRSCEADHRCSAQQAGSLVSGAPPVPHAVVSSLSRSPGHATANAGSRGSPATSSRSTQAISRLSASVGRGVTVPATSASTVV